MDPDLISEDKISGSSTKEHLACMSHLEAHTAAATNLATTSFMGLDLESPSLAYLMVPS